MRAHAATLLALGSGLLLAQCQKPETPTPLAPQGPGLSASAGSASTATGSQEAGPPPRMSYPLLHTGPKTPDAGKVLKAKADGCIEVAAAATLDLTAGDHATQKITSGKSGTVCLRKGDTVKVVTSDRYWIAGTVEALEP
jgi:hypothetical protein